MDDKIYSKGAISRYVNTNFFFNDPVLKSFFENNDISSFRRRVHEHHTDKSFEKMVYVIVTDTLRDIILNTVGEITEHTQTMGDVIISGGEAFNLYVERSERVVTSDIDTKFVPKMKYDTHYFGKLQAIKLILWDKLGQISKKISARVMKRFEERSKMAKFIGLKCTGPVTRRYGLISKSKKGMNNQPSPENVFIDVELFALDLGVRYFSITQNKIKNENIGGILDIPIMRPGEFGYEVVLTKKRGIVYIDHDTGKYINNNKVFVASKEFLIKDVYLMHTLGLRPEKKEKNKERLFKLSKEFVKSARPDESIETLFEKASKNFKIPRAIRTYSTVPMKKALQVNPMKYTTLTTVPKKEKLARQFIYGLRSSINTNVPGYKKTHGNEKFNVHTLTWKKNTQNAYVKNEYNLRPNQPVVFPKKINTTRTLYGYKPRRDAWVPRKIITAAAAIPFVGLKNTHTTHT